MTAFSRLVLPRAAAPHSLTVGQIAGAYRFPTETADGKPLDGLGQTVAIVELGGAYSPTDLAKFCAGSGITVPSVTATAVGGASIVADPGGADVEVMLDVEVVAAAAPGAKQVVLFGDNTDAGFLDAINAAIALNPCAISISWGGPESSWSTATMRAFDTAFLKASAAGIAVFCAAGDNGDLDGTGKKVADFPASSPNVFACGGTRLTLDASGARLTETPWDDGGDSAGGGGFSGLFARPTWQPTSVGTHRGLPDLAGNADPQSGYEMVTGGQWTVVGGTSAVAPLMAGLWARLCQWYGGHIPNAAIWLYANPKAFVDITSGTGRDIYPASAGWDAATGLGVPVGTVLVALLGSPTPPPPVDPPPSSPQPTAAALAVNAALVQLEAALPAWRAENGLAA